MMEDCRCIVLPACVPIGARRAHNSSKANPTNPCTRWCMIKCIAESRLGDKDPTRSGAMWVSCDTSWGIYGTMPAQGEDEGWSTRSGGCTSLSIWAPTSVCGIYNTHSPPQGACGPDHQISLRPRNHPRIGEPPRLVHLRQTPAQQ
jgi:hypothetical protein